MQLAFADSILDLDRRELHRGGEQVQVERQVFDVLAMLIANADRVVTKEELLDHIWGDRFVSESTLSTRIKQARKAVGDDGRAQRLIKTIHGVGYRCVAHVTSAHDREGDGAASTRRPWEAAGSGAAGGIDPPPTHYADSNGASIAYQTFGEGLDVVFIAGFATNVELMWEHPDIAGALRRFGSFARVTVLDKRGVGCSERPSADLAPSLEVRANDLLAVMDSAGIERATVMGSSEGGSLAAMFAAAHPERTERLVLHGTWVMAPDLARLAARVEQLWGTGEVFSVLGPALAATAPGRRFLARYERQSATPRLARALVDMLAQIDIRDVLGSIRVPTLVVHRRDDDIVPFRQAELLSQGIDGAQLVDLPGSNHYLLSSDASDVFDAIDRFMTGTEAPVFDPNRALATVMCAEPVHGAHSAGEAGAVTVSAEPFTRAAEQAVVAEGGEFVGSTEHGIVAVFDGPGRAIHTARVLRERAADPSRDVRIGIHTAEVVRRRGHLAGAAVEIADRVAGVAAPNEIWVSRTVTDLVAGNAVSFEPRGSYDLDGAPTPWDLFAVLG